MMPDMIVLLLQSRKAFIALTTILGVTLVTCVGVWKGVDPSAILGLVGAITAISWKLVESIASEDNSQRMLEAAHPEDGPR